MTDLRRAWTEDDITRLKSMAGKIPAKEVAAALGRSGGATAVAASKLKLSLRPQSRRLSEHPDRPAG
jgi:hypothetical protein